MARFLIEKLFSLLIGKFSKEEKDKYWERFTLLMAEIARASAKGAVEGSRDTGT